MKRSIKSLLATLVVSLSIAAPVLAGSFVDAEIALERGDYATALQLWRPLAEQGNRDAQHNLGVMYGKGQGVPQDYAKAMAWYRKAAEQGLADAQHNLGVLYDKGNGVPQDYTKALKWYRKAAEQGFAKAQYNLGVMYGKGLGVPQDYVMAHKWWNLAAAKGVKKAASLRDSYAQKMTPAQIAEAQRLAREWKPKKVGL